MQDCIFCKIISGKVPANIVLENDSILAFEAIEAQAPVHILIIPKKHITSINDIKFKDRDICGDMLLAAKKLQKLRILIIVAIEQFLIQMKTQGRLCFIYICIFLVEEK